MFMGKPWPVQCSPHTAVPIAGQCHGNAVWLSGFRVPLYCIIANAISTLAGRQTVGRSHASLCSTIGHCSLVCGLCHCGNVFEETTCIGLLLLESKNKRKKENDDPKHHSMDIDEVKKGMTQRHIKGKTLINISACIPMDWKGDSSWKPQLR